MINNHNTTINNGRIVIEKKPLMKLLYILGALAFVIAGLWMIRSNIQPFLGWISIIFFGLCGIFLVRQLFCFKPVLVIDENGITDNSTAISIGFIPWSDVESLELNHIATESFIRVNIKNVENYLKSLSFFKQKMIEANIKLDYGVVNINLGGTGYKPDEVINDVYILFEKYKKGDE